MFDPAATTDDGMEMAVHLGRTAFLGYRPRGTYLTRQEAGDCAGLAMLPGRRIAWLGGSGHLRVLEADGSLLEHIPGRFAPPLELTEAGLLTRSLDAGLCAIDPVRLIVRPLRACGELPVLLPGGVTVWSELGRDGAAVVRDGRELFEISGAAALKAVRAGKRAAIECECISSRRANVLTVVAASGGVAWTRPVGGRVGALVGLDDGALLRVTTREAQLRIEHYDPAGTPIPEREVRLRINAVARCATRHPSGWLAIGMQAIDGPSLLLVSPAGHTRAIGALGTVRALTLDSEQLLLACDEGALGVLPLLDDEREPPTTGDGPLIESLLARRLAGDASAEAVLGDLLRERGWL